MSNDQTYFVVASNDTQSSTFTRFSTSLNSTWGHDFDTRAESVYNSCKLDEYIYHTSYKKLIRTHSNLTRTGAAFIPIETSFCTSATSELMLTGPTTFGPDIYDALRVSKSGNPSYFTRTDAPFVPGIYANDKIVYYNTENAIFKYSNTFKLLGMYNESNIRSPVIYNEDSETLLFLEALKQPRGTCKNFFFFFYFFSCAFKHYYYENYKIFLCCGSK